MPNTQSETNGHKDTYSFLIEIRAREQVKPGQLPIHAITTREFPICFADDAAPGSTVCRYIAHLLIWGERVTLAIFINRERDKVPYLIAAGQQTEPGGTFSLCVNLGNPLEGAREFYNSKATATDILSEIHYLAQHMI